MAIESQVSIHGIMEFGEWSATSVIAGGDTIEHNTDNIYTLVPYGFTSEEGARITPSVSTVQQRSGQSAIIVDSFISEAGAQLGVRLLSGTLTVLRRLLGLPTSALTGDLAAGTPTAETLIVRGGELGTEEKSLYMKTMGPLGPRTYYLPRCKVASFPELAHSRTEYFEPNATFDVYENDAGEVFWVVDAAA
jgi:hypothetical protein